MYKRFVKRFLDVFIAILGIIVLAIPMLIIAVIIKLDSTGPAIFKQDRIGKDGKVYKMYKFRSMCIGAEQMSGGVYSDDFDFRISRVGKVLRKTSLDELPQLFNILKGEMSLIGFRSPLTYHPWSWEKYTDEQRKMFSVRPGITGWAQINGRKTVEWNNRIEMNVWYAKNISFMLDFKIFFLTIFKVLKNSDNENVGETVIIASDEMEIITK